MPSASLTIKRLRSRFDKWARSSFKEFLINVIRQGPVPEHMAFIMDGNRRFAKQHRMPIAKAHYQGALSLIHIIEDSAKCGVAEVTVYAFSIENLKRTQEQLRILFELFRTPVEEFEPAAGQGNMRQRRIRILGRLDLLPEDVRRNLQAEVENTKNNTGIVLNVCIAYTSRDEITTAIRRTVEGSQAGKAITQTSLTENMFTTDSPPLDLLVRTSGVRRLSDFLLWQCHQDTEIQVVDTLWPSFSMWHLFWILLKWQRTQNDNIPDQSFAAINTDYDGHTTAVRAH
ncbi:putative undecaprenyl diphosphate synthase-domain-containing protein [Aspergillus aurantiobrunneus]